MLDFFCQQNLRHGPGQRPLELWVPSKFLNPGEGPLSQSQARTPTPGPCNCPYNSEKIWDCHLDHLKLT